jgi:hypothetical protein
VAVAAKCALSGQWSLCCVQVLSSDAAFIRVATASGANSGYQFKTHPNIDKAAYSESGTLGLRDPSRPFPTGNALGILKWRLQVLFSILVDVEPHDNCHTVCSLPASISLYIA